MTQTLTFASHRFVGQVSDRLITMPDATAFDSASNKALIFVARDGVVSIAYSGSAYMYHTPTDECVAEWLTGSQLTGSGPRGCGVATHFGPLPRSLDIGGAVRLLADRCSAWLRLAWPAQRQQEARRLDNHL